MKRNEKENENKVKIKRIKKKLAETPYCCVVIYYFYHDLYYQDRL